MCFNFTQSFFNAAAFAFKLFLKKQYINCVYHPRAAHSFSKNFRFNRQECYDTQRGNSSYFAPPLRPFAFSSRTLRLNPNLNPKKKNYQLCFPSASSAQRTAHSISKKLLPNCVYAQACRLPLAACGFPAPPIVQDGQPIIFRHLESIK